MKTMLEQNLVRHLHLFESDQRKNEKAPHKLVSKTLNAEAEFKKKEFIGMQPSKDAKILAEIEREEQRQK